MSQPPMWQRAVVGAQSRTTPILRAAVDRQEVAAGIGLLQTLRGIVVRTTEAPSRRRAAARFEQLEDASEGGVLVGNYFVSSLAVGELRG